MTTGSPSSVRQFPSQQTLADAIAAVRLRCGYCGEQYSGDGILNHCHECGKCEFDHGSRLSPNDAAAAVLRVLRGHG